MALEVIPARVELCYDTWRFVALGFGLRWGMFIYIQDESLFKRE